MKTKLSYGLVLNLIFSAFYLTVNAQTVGDTFTENDILYTVTEVGTPNEVSTTDYKGTVTTVNIPNTVTDAATGFSYNVTAIGDDSFENNSLTGVTIGNNVTTIGYYAFRSNALTNVTLPNSVTTIHGYAFGNNALTSVTLPNSVTTIGVYAFGINALTSVTLPNSVTTIGAQAFYANALTSVTIGENVTSIGNYAFSYSSVPLTTVTSLSTTPVTLPSKVFDYYGDNSGIDLIIPTGTTAGYTTALWTGFNTVTESATASIVDESFNSKITVFPNPIVTTVKVQLTDNQELEKIEVFNILGKKVSETKNTSVDFSGFNGGIYILKIENTEGKIAVKKIIKK